MTVLDLIMQSFQIVGSYGIGESANASDSQLGLQLLNNLIDGFNTARINLYTTLFYQPSLTPTVQSYQIGPGAANFPTGFSVIQIQSCSCVIPGTQARKDVSLINSTQWAAIGERNLTGVFPDKLYCDYAYPISNLNFHPIPSGAITLDMYLWSILQQFTNLTQVLQLRPGYTEALVYGLAVKAYAPFGLTPDPTVLQLAATYKQNMQQLNASSGLATALSSSTTLNMPTEGIPPPPQQGPPNQ